MAGKELHPSFSPPEVRLKRQFTRRNVATIALGGGALYLARNAAAQHEEQPNTPTPTPTPARKELVKADGVSIAIQDQQTLQTIGPLLSGLGLITTTIALLYIRGQAKAAEKTAEATRLALLTSIYENLMTRGDAINTTFLEHPEFYNQLFDTPHVGPRSMKRTADRQRDTQLLATALRLADFFEITIDLGYAIPEYARDSWEKYMKTVLKNSRPLRNLVKNTPWYGEPIKKLCAEVEQDMRRFQPLTKLLQPIPNIPRTR